MARKPKRSHLAKTKRPHFVASKKKNKKYSENKKQTNKIKQNKKQVRRKERGISSLTSETFQTDFGNSSASGESS